MTGARPVAGAVDDIDELVARARRQSLSSAVVSPALSTAPCIRRHMWDDGMNRAVSAHESAARRRAGVAASD